MSSGNGGNLKFLHQLEKLGVLSKNLDLKVLADRRCGATDYAGLQGISHQIINFDSASEPLIIDYLHKEKPDLILTNVYRILSSKIIDAFSDIIINSHFSILPSFGGLIGSKTVTKALQYGSKITGVTIHRVTTEVDSGEHLVQGATPVLKEESFSVHMDRTFRLGCMALLTAILQKCDDYELKNVALHCILGEDTMLCPSFDPKLFNFDEDYWSCIKS